MHKQLGRFITLDGPNGVGKTATISLVSRLLRDRDWLILQTKEPTPRFNRGSEELRGAKLASLIVEDRRAHLAEEIVPALNDGYSVVCDRYIESSLVYCFLDGTPMKETWLDHSMFRRPDLRILITASFEAIDQRLADRKFHSRFERECTREDELSCYFAAHAFMCDQGIVSAHVDNTLLSTQQTAEEIVRLIVETFD